MILQRCVRCSLLCQDSMRVLVASRYSTLLPESTDSDIHEDSSRQKSHWFETGTPRFRYKAQVIKDLLKTRIYEDDYILVLNKPSGLPMQSPKYKDSEESGKPDDPDISVASLLSDMQDTLNTPLLQCMFSLNRLTSGIIVLAKNERAKEMLSKYFLHTRTNNVIQQKYWAVTVGIPEPPMCEPERLLVKLDRVAGWKLGIKALEDSRRKRVQKEMIVAHVGLKTLSTYKSSQSTMSLVELTPSTTKWDVLHVFLLHKLVAILGDHKYSGRLKTILGQPAILDHKTHLPAPQVLPHDIQQKLALDGASGSEIIPLHLHCGQLDLPLIHPVKGFMKCDTLSVTATVPSFFLRTMRTFHLVPKRNV